MDHRRRQHFGAYSLQPAFCLSRVKIRTSEQVLTWRLPDRDPVFGRKFSRCPFAARSTNTANRVLISIRLNNDGQWPEDLIPRRWHIVRDVRQIEKMSPRYGSTSSIFFSDRPLRRSPAVGIRSKRCSPVAGLVV
jgi:hypothetical protein